MKKTKERCDIQINLRISARLLAAVQEDAKRAGRKRQPHIMTILESHLAATNSIADAPREDGELPGR